MNHEERQININVPVLARVEGEGALDLQIRAGAIAELKLRIYEPPRLFEKLLEGRHLHEVPDIVARICGICPIAYQMSAVHALESILGVGPGPWVRDMRRVVYCGEWVESHSLHIHLLALPDFLGYANAPDMARDHPHEVRRGLRLQDLGNSLIKLFGGRSVHPVGVRVGGFHHAPAAEAVAETVEKLRAGIADAVDLLRWVASLDLPRDEQDFICMSLRHPVEYPMNEGDLLTSDGRTIPATAFAEHVEEHHVPHSTALHARLDGKPYLVGPLARLNLNLDRLPTAVRDVLAGLKVRFPSRNMFHSLVARAAEILYALTEAERLLRVYHVPDAPYVDGPPRAGIGFGCTEAPRGVLWHRYECDERGLITRARIVPPTSQNQARIEEDLRRSLQSLGLDRPEEELRRRSETVIRNYDPCISCATHFLTLRVERR
jgi:sulfhydrogenase subunit alpha